MSITGGGSGTEGAAQAARLASHAAVIRGAVDGARLVALCFVDRSGAVKAAQLIARFLAGGGAVVAASSSSPARLRLPAAGVGDCAAEENARQEAAGVARFVSRKDEAGGPGAAGMTGISRVNARFLDGRETVVVGESSSTAAHVRLLPPDAAVSPNMFLSFWRRRPRPEASISTKSSSMFMARFLSVGKRRPSRLAVAVGWAAGAAGGARSSLDPPGDRAAVAATTPSGAILNSICSVFRFIGVESLTSR